METRLEKICTGLGIDRDFRAKLFANLSGGEKTRINLARLILVDTEILLLDEPTNHLDLSATVWLEDYVSHYKGTVLVISHDRYFLDKTISRVIEIQGGKAAFYAGKAAAYGIPLESGTHLARTEWTLWAAMLASDAKTAARLTAPLYRYMNEAESRVPMPDTYDAGSAKWAKQANRPAVGGCFIRLAGERLKKQ